jgi:hypothetical protein
MDTFYHLLPSKTPLPKPKPKTKELAPAYDLLNVTIVNPDDTEERISRDEQFVAKSSVTHLTSILSASEIELLYDNRLRWRIRDMFNLISFNINSNDKR